MKTSCFFCCPKKLPFGLLFHFCGRKNIVRFVVFVFQVQQFLNVVDGKHDGKSNHDHQNRVRPVDGEPAVARAFSDVKGLERHPVGIVNVKVVAFQPANVGKVRIEDYGGDQQNEQHPYAAEKRFQINPYDFHDHGVQRPEHDENVAPNVGLRPYGPNSRIACQIVGDDQRAERGDQVQAPSDGCGDFTSENQRNEHHNVAEMANLQGNNAGAKPFAHIYIDVPQQ